MKFITAAALITSLFGSICCSQSIDPKLAESLNSELARVRQQIEATKAEDEKYSGGLIKSLIATRLAILFQTEAMLTQKANSWNFGIDLSYTVDGKPFVLPETVTEQLSGVQFELTELDNRITAAEAEAALYSGGLVLAVKLSTIATMQQTRAMLDQKRLSLIYRLPQYLPFVKASESDNRLSYKRVRQKCPQNRV